MAGKYGEHGEHPDYGETVVVMWGFNGYLPDSVYEYDSVDEAIDGILEVFRYDISPLEEEYLRVDLKEGGYHEFYDSRTVGAEYVELVVDP